MMMARGWNVVKGVWPLRHPFMATVPFTTRRITDGPKKDAKASLSLVPLVTKEEQLSWAEKIKSHVPHCVTMYNNLLQHGRGHVSHDTFYVLHGRSSSHAVVCDKKISPTRLHIGIFCLEEEVDQVTEALASASIINWRNANIILHHVPPYLLTPLQRLAEQNGVEMDVTHHLVYTFDRHSEKEELRIGKGFRMCRLGRAGVHRLVEGAVYDEGMPLEMRYSLAQQLPFVGIYQDATKLHDTTVDALNLPVAGDEEMPVGWACSKPLGDTGKVAVEESFRRRGFANLVAKAVGRQQQAFLGFIPHGFVHEDNFISRLLCDKMVGLNYTHDAFRLSSMKPQE